MKVIPRLYWIDGPWRGRMAVAPRPRGGDWLDDEISAIREAGVDVIASLLMPDEADELELTKERAVAERQGMDFVSLPAPDRDIPPSRSAAIQAARTLAADLEQGRNVMIHCRQGIGRAATLAALVFAEAGIPPAEALSRIRDARGLDVPETAEQRDWIERVARSISPR
jgi:protein-tyrosine phosphatase